MMSVRGLRKEDFMSELHLVLYLYNKTPKLTNDISRVCCQQVLGWVG